MAVRKGKKPELSSEELKAKICAVARKHFAMQGVAGASLKHIAAEAQVAGSLINYHFKDKDGLFRSCIEPFARGRMEAIQRILGDPKTAEEMRVRLELFIEEMQASVIADKDNFEILDREMRSQNPMVLKIFEETLLLAFKSVVHFFRKAQQNGLIVEELDPMILSSMLFTTTCDSARKDLLGKKFFNVSFEQAEWRHKFAQQVAAIFLKGVLK
jgi:AcrR family transcriptional regulator